MDRIYSKSQEWEMIAVEAKEGLVGQIFAFCIKGFTWSVGSLAERSYS